MKLLRLRTTTPVMFSPNGGHSWGLDPVVGCQTSSEVTSGKVGLKKQRFLVAYFLLHMSEVMKRWKKIRILLTLDVNL